MIVSLVCLCQCGLTRLAYHAVTAMTASLRRLEELVNISMLVPYELLHRFDTYIIIYKQTWICAVHIICIYIYI